MDADDLRARVRLRRVPVGGDHDDVVAQLDEVLDEAEEAVLHAGDVRERGGLDEDADALALAGRRHGGGVVRGRRGDARGDGRDGHDAGEARPDDLAGDSIVFARAG